MLSYKQLQAFVTLAQSNTFAEAAEKIHLSQPALSSSIKKLEQQLGGELFSRTTRKVALSKEGAEFVPVAMRLIHDWDSSLADMRDLFAMQRGKLTLAAMPSFASSILPKIVKSFHQQWHGINLTIRDVVMEDVINLVRVGRAEIGFSFETEQLDGLVFKTLMTNEFIAVFAPQHPLAQRDTVSWHEIAQYHFVAMNRGSSIRLWIEQFTQQHDLRLNIVVEANQLSTVGEFVKTDMGVSVVPGICQQQFSQSGLACVAIEGVNLSRKIGMLKTHRKSLSVPAKAMWESILENHLGN
ncbi:MAG: LysR family transcriptional regulator [Aliiglaciecola sp.]